MCPILMRRFDRKPVLLGGLGCLTVFAQLVVDLRLLGWLPENHSPLLMPCLLANSCGFFFILGVASPTIMSMLGDVVDENELRTGKRQAGLSPGR